MRTALVIEDEEAIRHLISELLQEQGFQRVLDATTGAEAVALVQENDVDLVVLDYRLTSESGIDVAGRLRAQPSFNAPVLVTTALPKRQAEEVCAEAGACECIIKPFDITDFLQGVQNCLEKAGTPLPA